MNALEAGALIVGGLVAFGAWLLAGSKGATAPAHADIDPEAPPAPATKPGGAAAPVVPPSSSTVVPAAGGRDFVHDLPPTATPAREAKILEAVRQGFIRPIAWQRIDFEKDGHACTVFVADDALAVGTAEDFVRVNVNHETAQRIADVLAACLPTSRISDLAWLHASVLLVPHRQTSDAHMADTLRMLAHHDAIETERAGRTGLVRTVGKDWVNSERMTPHEDGSPARPMDANHNELPKGSLPAAINYGWQMKGAPDRSLGGVPVLQTLGRRHDFHHVDYSQTVSLVRADVVVDGVSRMLVDVLADPATAYLFSDEVARGVACKVTRHPAVPMEAAA